jgi:hypothetical protein
MTNRKYKRECGTCRTRPYIKVQVRCLIDNLRAFEKKERRLRVCRVVGVGEAVPDHTVLIH